MDKHIFLIRVNPEDWTWGDKLHNWDSLEIGGNVSFDGNSEQQRDISKIKLHDIFLGYNMDHPKMPLTRNKKIVCVGRIISDGFFKSVGKMESNNKRFLVQKVVTLTHPIDISKIPYQPAVIKLTDDEWTSIKKDILEKEPPHKNLIEKLEIGWEDISF